MTRTILALLLSLGCDEPDSNAPRDSGTDAGHSDTGADSGPLDSGTNDTGVANDGGTNAACSTGELTYYSFSPVSPLPAVSMIELPDLISGAEIITAGNGTEYSVRFEVCQENGAPVLRALLYYPSSFETPTYYRWDDTISAPVEDVVEIEEGLVVQRRLPPSSFLVEGLAAALQGNLQDLRVRMVGDYGILIWGHDGFAALAQGNIGANTIVYTSIYVVVGGLVPGNVFEDLLCDFGEATLTKTFVMATASFDTTACTFLGGGETIGYRITSLAITDSSAELTPAEQATHTFTGEAEVASVMTYAWNHHNGCDSFHLALPHADYAATASPLAGCGTPVPNAPIRDPNLPGPVQFRIRYHGGAWTDGELVDCNHYLFCSGE